MMTLRQRGGRLGISTEEDDCGELAGSATSQRERQVVEETICKSKIVFSFQIDISPKTNCEQRAGQDR